MQKLSGIEIYKFKYESEEQRKEHVKDMEAHGYTCTGQIKNRDNYYDIKSKEYWYGEFYKAI